MEILSYLDKHHDGIVKLWQEVFPNPPKRNEPNSVIEAKLRIHSELFLVAIENNKVIGTVMSGYDGHRGWLYYVAVSPEYRRKGVGSTLIKQAEQRLISLGCVKINLQILPDNSEVQKFYRTLGYETEQRISMGNQLYS
jgi:ribosomal protein S18 acetylase RimI-like enzyme